MVCDNITDHIAAEQASLHLAWRASPGRLRASPMRNFGLGYVLVPRPLGDAVRGS
jgi:hypothetical protein